MWKPTKSHASIPYDKNCSIIQLHFIPDYLTLISESEAVLYILAAYLQNLVLPREYFENVPLRKRDMQEKTNFAWQILLLCYLKYNLKFVQFYLFNTTFFTVYLLYVTHYDFVPDVLCSQQPWGGNHGSIR